ncbi:hypothetical protein CCACVL1_10643 [Corchorus capsularis]|uniref:Uncharacterized protein n=1 Tax=Corchorus capsularis TaxID=210143 RepID=A0A1R3IQF6_COCAP|nr:hypothetical protein CCACVL1_10643 [Corchorus capsularis]
MTTNLTIREGPLRKVLAAELWDTITAAAVTLKLK